MTKQKQALFFSSFRLVASPFGTLYEIGCIFVIASPGFQVSGISLDDGYCLRNSEVVKPVFSQSCLTLCDPMDCSLPGPSVHGILQARILEWVAIPFSRDLPDPGLESASPVCAELQAPCLPMSYRESPAKPR